ncbi:MAG TPA: hypothetical protein VHM19_20440 [Polyangiales bacterium]|jgi:hypothetical protein|nr:hypothetical protein [Polyangiales bacterium]
MLSQFSADYFARSPVLVYPILALALFLGVFVVISVRAARTKKPELERMASLPLE